MKISVLTPTYNRSHLLERLYASLVQNSKFGIEIEWLIIDDGSIIPPKEIVDRFIAEIIMQANYLSNIKAFTYIFNEIILDQSTSNINSWSVPPLKSFGTVGSLSPGFKLFNALE